MEKNDLPEKSPDHFIAISLIYNTALLLFFTILMVIIQEWYIMIMLVFIDRHYFSKEVKNIQNGGD